MPAGDPLPDLDSRHFLQHAIDAGANGQLVHLLSLQIVSGAGALQTTTCCASIWALIDSSAISRRCFCSATRFASWLACVDGQFGFKIALQVKPGQLKIPVRSQFRLVY